MKIDELDTLIKSVCPIHGINSNGVIWYKDDATEEQKLQAQDLMNEHFSTLEVIP